ncbi:molybdenum cofactor cytidylyltransferase [Inquilinus ginsengisoli]|uniref:Molybdenum cofactor cytidylyltransferase n=1 Tax=Inquilinus ginsengisoli TaxID=363840 RepID=A0ABU1JWT1_9PROT|nr:molybdopterin-binding/glycosyltransferase family 2 protein [Inquilinus ginsengisoli]MDR6293073.1 molybdenum cofactor cytidylyltransferase [Inquilinus ginsengisoli]
MIFGTLSTTEAAGAILAHTVAAGDVVFRKGRRLSEADAATLRAAGVQEIQAARLERGDIHEDQAAERVATVLQGPGLTASAAFTGRVNLFAEAAGVVVIDRERIDRLNRLDESITIATLPEWAEVAPKQMVATIKIIPFAAPTDAVALVEVMSALPERGPALRLARYRPLKVGLIQTRLPTTKPSVLDKTAQITTDRLARLGGTLVRERRSEHKAPALTSEIRMVQNLGLDLLLIIGASAITDRRDVLPAAIEASGGIVEHFGMPVDPGNLLLMGRIGAMPVLGLPGCARSPKLNGFDWVLQRLAAGLNVTRLDVMAMGVGGLLAEIPTRPLPRDRATEANAMPHAPHVGVVVLAAGQSRRMGELNKLLAPVEGKPMVAHAVDAALGARGIGPVVVVTGHERGQVEAALPGRAVIFTENPRYAEGLSTSLAAGLAALPQGIDAALVCLGDMPRIAPRLIERLIAAYAPTEGRSIVVPTHQGKRGNPVLWDRRFFPAMAAVAGDVGARHLIGEHSDEVVEIEAGDPTVLFDVDTPETLSTLSPTKVRTS